MLMPSGYRLESNSAPELSPHPKWPDGKQVDCDTHIAKTPRPTIDSILDSIFKFVNPPVTRAKYKTLRIVIGKY